MPLPFVFKLRQVLVASRPPPGTQLSCIAAVVEKRGSTVLLFIIRLLNEVSVMRTLQRTL